MRDPSIASLPHGVAAAEPVATHPSLFLVGGESREGLRFAGVMALPTEPFCLDRSQRDALGALLESLR